MTIVRLLILVTLIFNFVASTAIDDAKCDAQLEYFDQALSKHEKWAIELFDAWTKLQSGIVSGNVNDFGHFDQCVKFRHESDDTKVEKIQGKHCMIFYRALENATEHESDRKFDWREIVKLMRERSLRLGAGVCLPSTCSAAKIRHYVNETVLSSSDLVITNDYDQSIFCSTNDSIPFETIDVVAIVILSIFALLLLSSTLYEILMIQRNQRPHELFSAFSVYKNGKKLFDMKRGQSTSIIHCLPGLRTLSMFHIMSSLWKQRGIPIINTNVFSSVDGEWNLKYWASILTIFHIAVDLFLVIGGCLLARSTMGQK
ncbi:hypothetical protein PVAND_008490 [Polypedilum vanderplanki]|uniref:Nose resistant-to-fluoxetine protein N-terminal domain-containing protein n=1 Tax=Polypedilum vanderplanki TaxID=319348 RepID=A0A9J6CAS9_POLVA|nr:hypothetical protein PVAND_008490 [Polypedilum vanderplanki]